MSCGRCLVFRPLVNSVWQCHFSYFSSKTYVVGTQKNHLNETVLHLNEMILLSTQNSHMGKKENNNNFTFKFLFI